MKEQILRDIGDEVSFKRQGKIMKGTISMITVTRKGIKYRVKFLVGTYQCDFPQEDLIIDNTD